MKAIKIEDTFHIFSQVPKSWNGNDDYRNESDAKHRSDGFKDLIYPPFNSELELYGEIIEVNGNYTFKVILIPDEIKNRRLQEKIDSDASASKLAKAISDGKIMYQRFFAVIQRQFDSGNLTATQARNSVLLLWNPLLPINYGQFIVAQLSLNALVPPINAKELAILNLAKQQIANYLSQPN